MLNFSPKEVIWWTMEMYFWEIVNTVRIMGLISFLLQYGLVMQAIWCLKF